MNPERHQRVMELLSRAMERTGQDPEPWLAEVCAGDDGLQVEVMSLLKRRKPAAAFLEEPLLNLIECAEPDTPSIIGEHLGPYRIIKELGRGGMGAVYLGERADRQFQKSVAVKLIKRGMDTDFVIRRFRNERQILANLDHPNIARLLDGGTTSADLPYFIMEYVEGMPITDYVKTHNLSTQDRLKLFLTVCSAVSYAHQNLIVHRDLKPSNILITNRSDPKLLDFGIAKILNSDKPDETNISGHFLGAMTPEYASPEQVRGEPITTATDVYSLGVLLYELLTGRRPYKVKGRSSHEIVKAISDQQPVRPSHMIKVGSADEQSGRSTTAELKGNLPPAMVIRQFKGDLDTIVLKALRKEPEQRYLSVEQFAEDIRRHLNGLPVSARKGTFSYLASRFVQRNKVAVSAAIIILATLVGGIITTMWQAHNARVESAKANRRFDDVRNLVNKLLFQLDDEIAKLPGSTNARRLLVKQTLDYLDRVSSEAGGDEPLQQEMATAYQRLGDVQSRLNAPNVGDTKGALESYTKALEIRKTLFAANPNDLQNGVALAMAHNRVGDVLSKVQNTRDALDHRRQAVDIAEKLSSANEVAIRKTLGYCYLMLGRAYLTTGNLTNALEVFRRSQTIREAMAAENPTDPATRRALVSTYDGIAFVLSLFGKPDEALDYYLKSRAISESLVAESPADADFRRALMDTYEWLGITLGELGRNAEGLDYHHQALDIARTQLAVDPVNAQARDDIADVYEEIGNTLTRLGKAKEAIGYYQKSVENYQTLSDADPTDANARRQICLTKRQMANALMLAGDSRGAVENYRAAVDAFTELARHDPDNAQTQYDLALSYRKLGEAETSTKDDSAALDDYQSAVGIFESLSARSPENTMIRADLALAYKDLGALASQTLKTTNNWREARSWFQKGLDIFTDLKTRGLLSKTNESEPEKLLNEIARCEANLKT